MVYLYGPPEAEYRWSADRFWRRENLLPDARFCVATLSLLDRTMRPANRSWKNLCLRTGRTPDTPRLNSRHCSPLDRDVRQKESCFEGLPRPNTVCGSLRSPDYGSRINANQIVDTLDAINHFAHEIANEHARLRLWRKQCAQPTHGNTSTGSVSGWNNSAGRSSSLGTYLSSVSDSSAANLFCSASLAASITREDACQDGLRGLEDLGTLAAGGCGSPAKTGRSKPSPARVAHCFRRLNIFAKF